VKAQAQEQKLTNNIVVKSKQKTMVLNHIKTLVTININTIGLALSIQRKKIQCLGLIKNKKNFLIIEIEWRDGWNKQKCHTLRNIMRSNIKKHKKNIIEEGKKRKIKKVNFEKRKRFKMLNLRKMRKIRKMKKMREMKKMRKRKQIIQKI